MLAENTSAGLAFSLFLWNFVPVTILLTWIRNNTNGSTLSAILVHIGLELQTNLGLWPWFSDKVIANSIILTLVAVAVILYTRGSLKRATPSLHDKECSHSALQALKRVGAQANST